jgi:hypothetical protein
MVFTPKLPLPLDITASYPFHAGLHYLNLIVPSQVIQKIMLLTIIILSAIGMHRLLTANISAYRAGKKTLKVFNQAVAPNTVAAYAAATFFAVNPFTYSRFMAGQYAVLLGYTLLPWFTKILLQTIKEPSARQAIKLGLLATLTGIVSIHTIGLLTVLCTSALGLVLWQRKHIKKFIISGLLAVGTFMLLSSYWLLPLLFGHGKIASTIDSFSTNDTQAFATAGNNPIVRAFNLVRLQGFWAESHGLYALPQQKIIMWGTLSLLVLVIVILGAITLYKIDQGQLLVFFAVTLIAGIVLAAGALDGAFGYREPQKFAGLIALSQTFFFAFGIAALLNKLRTKTKIFYATGIAAVILLPLVLTKVMLWGFNGQLSPHQYPTSWFAVNSRLQKDSSNFKTIILPWYQYMEFDFSDRIIANPAPKFFASTVLASTDPEFMGASSGQQDALHTAIQNILSANKNIGQKLADQNIKYILLSKEQPQLAKLLNRNPQLKLLQDYPELSLYQNQKWRQK